MTTKVMTMMMMTMPFKLFLFRTTATVQKAQTVPEKRQKCISVPDVNKP